MLSLTVLAQVSDVIAAMAAVATFAVIAYN